MNNHLQRVADNIADTILDFCQSRKTFFADDLRSYVENNCGKVAPASADRILRMLRQAGELNYRVISRKRSEYEILPVAA